MKLAVAAEAVGGPVDDFVAGFTTGDVEALVGLLVVQFSYFSVVIGQWGWGWSYNISRLRARNRICSGIRLSVLFPERATVWLRVPSSPDGLRGG